jgi:DNA-binding NarL/FixJ family response regulator
MTPLRILIVDDHAVVSRGVRSLLESQPGLEISRERRPAARPSIWRDVCGLTWSSWI